MIRSLTNGTILVVDDCESVCEVIHILLCRVGYHVLTANNGHDALDLVRMHPDIDLLICNVAMPGMGGEELADDFARLRPSASIVFISSTNGPIYSTVPFGFLLKPFTVTELRDTVSRALRMQPAAAENSCAA